MNELESRLTSWLQKVVATEEPSAEILAFRFGLSEDEGGYVVYLAGSKNYDEVDVEWAAYPPDYLADTEVPVTEGEVGEWKDMLLAMLHYLGIMLRRKPFSNSFLGGNIPVYTGFVDGDLYRVK